MSKTYKTGFVITGDASSGIKAVKMTREGLDELNATQKKSQSEWAATRKAQAEAAAAARSTEDRFNALNNSLKNTVGALAGLAGISFGIAGITDAVSSAVDLRRAVNQVATLLDDTSQMDRYRKNIVAMGREWGDTTGQAKALYNIVSAGHSGLAESARILEQANMLAMGGVTDVFIATDGLTSALNAYELKAGSAADVSDALFVAMKYGKTSIEELASNIGTIAPIAATAGASLDEMLAAAAAITSTGVSTSETMTQLKGVMMELINPSEQAAKYAKELGLDFSTAALKAKDLEGNTKGLAGFLEELKEKTGGSEVAMAKLFGNARALAGAMSLTGTTSEKFAEALAAMTEKAGESEKAVGKLAVGAEFALEMIAIKSAALKEEFGEGLLSAIEPSLLLINEKFEVLAGSIAAAAKVAAAVFAARLVAGVASSTAAFVAGQVQAFRYQATLASMAGVSRKTAVALTAQAAAARGASAAMALLGGPVGVATLAAGALAYFTLGASSAEKEADKLLGKIDGLAASFDKMNKSQAQAAMIKITDLQDALGKQIEETAIKIRSNQQDMESYYGSMGSWGSGADEAWEAHSKGVTLAKGEIADLESEMAANVQRLGELQAIIDGKPLAGLAEGASESGEAIGYVTTEADKIITALAEQYLALEMGERGWLAYQLAQKGANDEQIQQALNIRDLTEALKASKAEEAEALKAAEKAAEKAQSDYASILAKSTSSSVKSLADVEKQSKRVWSALASGKISAAQAASAIDGLAAAGATSEAALADFAASVLDSLDPLREIERTMESVWAAFDAGHLDADQVADYIDHIKDKLKEINDVQINPFEQLGGAISQTANGIKSIGGAMQGMYEDGSQGAKNLAVIMNAANVAAGVGAILQQGKASNPYEAFARMAAMAATVASLGVAVGGAFGGSGGADLSKDRQASQGTGTVLGDSSAKSESIANAIDITAAATSELVGINRGMLHALQSMRAGIEKATVRIAQGVSGADFEGITLKDNAFDKMSDVLNSDISNVLSVATFGLSGVLFGALGKGISKLMGGKTQVQDEGLQLGGGKLGAMRDDVDASAYQDTRTRKNRFASWKYATEMQDLGDEISNDFAKVLDSLADSVYKGATALGFAGDDVAEQINNFEIETQKISLKGLSAEDQQKEIEAVFSTIFDNLASSTVEFLPKFQQAGEALGETLARVATNVQVTEEAAYRLGFQAENLGVEQFATLSTAMVEAAGGLEDFISGMSSFVDKFAPEAHKFELLASDMQRALGAVGLEVPETKDAMWELMQTLDAGTEIGRSQIATLLEVTSTSDAYYKSLEKNAVMQAGLTGEDTDYLQNLANWSADELSRIEADYRERISLAEQQMRIGRELRQYVEQLKISELSPYDPGEKLELASEQFAKLLVRAEAGDMEAAAKLQDAANSYLQNADSYYGRSDSYVGIFEETVNALDKLGLDILGSADDNTLEKLNSQMLQEQQRIRDYTRDQLGWMVSQYDALTSIENLLDLLPESLAKQLGSIANSPTIADGAAQARETTKAMIRSQWEQMGGGTMSESDLERYASQIDSGESDISEITQELQYYQANNSKIMDQILELWKKTGGGDYQDADFAKYAADIAAGRGELSVGDLNYYRSTQPADKKPSAPAPTPAPAPAVTGEDISWAVNEITSRLGHNDDAYMEIYNLAKSKGVSLSRLESFIPGAQSWASSKGLPAFAKGGVFTNSIVSKPTYFDMGLMGEAGDEAIVPLHMGPHGLGIKNYAGAAQAPQQATQADPELIAELRQLRGEVAQLRSEQSHFNSKAEQQRSDQQQATEAVVRATKATVGVI